MGWCRVVRFVVEDARWSHSCPKQSFDVESTSAGFRPLRGRPAEEILCRIGTDELVARLGLYALDDTGLGSTVKKDHYLISGPPIRAADKQLTAGHDVCPAELTISIV